MAVFPTTESQRAGASMRLGASAPPALHLVDTPKPRPRPCDICSVDDAVLLFRPRRAPGPVVRCRKCGLVYVSPLETVDSIVSEARPWGDASDEVRSSDDLALLEGRWEKDHIQDIMSEYPQKVANAHRLLEEIEALAPRGKLLDFGCGPGVFLSAAKQRGWDVTGLEPHVGFAIYGRGGLGVNIVNGILAEDTFPENHFDVITAIQVVEHLTTPLEVISLLTRFIKPGGLLVVEVPTVDNYGVRLLRGKHRHFVEDHLYFFNTQTLRLLLEKAGLRVVKQGFSERRLSVRSVVSQFLRHAGVREPARARIASRLPFAGATVSLNLRDIGFAVAVKPT